MGRHTKLDPFVGCRWIQWNHVYRVGLGKADAQQSLNFVFASAEGVTYGAAFRRPRLYPEAHCFQLSGRNRLTPARHRAACNIIASRLCFGCELLVKETV